MRRASGLLLVVSLCACARVQAPGSLQKAYDGVPRSPLCQQNLPMEWVATWPLPTKNKDEYRALFYALDRRALDASGVPRIRVTEPRGEAVFTADGKVSKCESTPLDIKPLEGERYSEKAADLDEEAFDKATAKLLSLTETLAGAFQRGAPPDTKSAMEFREQFDLLAEPPLRKRYEAMAPEFWAWLAKAK